MAHAKLVVNNRLRSGKYIIFFVVALLLLIWGLETPPGILGKADAVGYAVCHRIDLRSFHIGLRQLPLCARCTGQYVGAMLSLFFQAVIARRCSGFPSRRLFVVLALPLVAYMVDGLNSYLYLPPFLEVFPHLPHLYLPSNALRLLTGTGMGLLIALILYPAFVSTIYAHLDPQPVMRGIKPLLILTGFCLLVDLLILNGASSVLYIAAIISALGVIVLLSMAYTIVILRIFRMENKYVHLSQIGLPLLIGILITMLQIGLFDLLRFLITDTWSGFVFG